MLNINSDKIQQHKTWSQEEDRRKVKEEPRDKLEEKPKKIAKENKSNLLKSALLKNLVFWHRVIGTN